MDNKLKEYADLSARIKADKARQEVLKQEIENELGQSDVKLDKEYGTFKMVGRKNWQYSEAVEIAAEDLAILKTEEQEHGIATHETVYSLRFNPKRSL